VTKDAALVNVFLKALLEDKVEDVRAGVAEAFRRMKQKPKAAIPAFLKALKDSNCRVRTGAACCVAETVKVGVAAPAILEALKGFQDTGTLLIQPAEALAAMGDPAVPFLVKALSDKDKVVREGAVMALGYVKRGSPAVIRAIPAIIKLLRDKESDVRFSACGTVWMLGEAASGAVPDLIHLLDDEDPYVRSWAAFALSEIGPAAAQAVPRLIKALKDKDRAMRRYAADVLAAIGHAAKAAVPALIEALKDEDLRRSAISALGAIGPDAKSAIPALQELQGPDEDLNFRVSVSIQWILRRPMPLPPLGLVPVIRRPPR
jgi:HEAT repeat protein